VAGYVVDTSGWIELWRKYPPAVFPLMWQKLQTLCASGELASPDDVRIELEAYVGDPILTTTLKSWGCLFKPLTQDVQNALANVMAGYSGLVSLQAGKGGADPIVVALGLAMNATVVTMEKPRKQPGDPPKIPDACTGLGVKVMAVLGFIPGLGLAL